MGEGNTYYLCLTTVPDDESAQRVAEALIRGKKSACVNILRGVTSIYWWEGEIQRDSEIYLFIKTRKDMKNDVLETIKKNHPYKVPEIIFLKIKDGSKPYLDWIDEILSK